MSACGAPLLAQRSDNICLELGRLWAGGNSAAFEVDCRIKQGSGTVVSRCSLVQRDGRNRSGECPTSRADPGNVSHYLLPCIPPPYAVIPKDRQACAIWPHFGFPGHILGIQTMPPPRLSLPSALPPLASTSSLLECWLEWKGSALPVIPVALFLFNPLVMGSSRSPLNSGGKRSIVGGKIPSEAAASGVWLVL